MRVLTIVILMAVNLGAALMMLSRMKRLWWVEWLIMGAAGLFILASFFGLWVDAEWSYPLATIIFALSLANLLWLYTQINYLTAFAPGLLASIAGVVVSLTGIGVKTEEQEQIETYDVPKELDHSVVMNPPKKTAKKTKKKKRSKKK